MLDLKNQLGHAPHKWDFFGPYSTENKKRTQISTDKKSEKKSIKLTDKKSPTVLDLKNELGHAPHK